MNPLWERLTKQLKDTGVKDAKNMAFNLLRRRGHIDSQGNLTHAGRLRSNLGAEGRAKDRASKSSGRSVDAYKYNPRTNRATLRFK